MSRKLQKPVQLPVAEIFSYYKEMKRVHILLYEQTNLRIEGFIIGFDEYMNVVLDDVVEVYVKKNIRKKIEGRLLLKGDNITAIADVSDRGVFKIS